MEEKAIHQAVVGLFAPIAGSFVIDSLLKFAFIIQ